MQQDVDAGKLQVLNDRICQVLDAIVEMRQRGLLSGAFAPVGSFGLDPRLAQPMMYQGPAIGTVESFGGVWTGSATLAGQVQQPVPMNLGYSVVPIR